MPWTATQKQIAVRAAKAAGLDDEHRRLVLLQFPHAVCGGRATSTSPRLTDSDFEQYMAIIERSGGQVLHFSPGYWAKKAADDCQRLRYLTIRIVRELMAHNTWELVSLQPESDIARWAHRTVATAEGKTFDQLTWHELHAVVNSLRGYAKRCGLNLSGSHGHGRPRRQHARAG